MAGPYSIFIDLNQDQGEQLAPEVRAEIAAVAPSTVTNGSITTAKLAEDSVTNGKIAPGAVGSLEIATSGVETGNLAPESVTTSKLAPDAVTPVKCGTGVVTARDADGNDIEWAEVLMTAAQYAALSTKDPNVVYNVTA